MSDDSDSSPFGSIKDAFLQRVNNSFFGFIFFAFCIDNWRDVMYAFSTSTSVEFRIDYISNNTTLVLPILSGIVAAVGYPYIQWVFELAHKKAIILRWELKSSELIAKKTAEDSVDFDKNKREAIHNAELKEIEYNANIKSLENEIDAATKKLNHLTSECEFKGNEIEYWDNLFRDLNGDLDSITNFARETNIALDTVKELKIKNNNNTRNQSWELLLFNNKEILSTLSEKNMSNYSTTVNTIINKIKKAKETFNRMNNSNTVK